MMWRSATCFASVAMLAVCVGCTGGSPSADAFAVSTQQAAPHVAAGEVAEAAVAPEDEDIRRLEAARGLVGPGDMEQGVFVWSEPGFRQKYYGTNFREFEVLDEVLDGAGEWIGKVHARRADFQVICVASARKDVLAMAGFAENGDFVLQRWTLEALDTEGAEAPAEAGRARLIDKRFVVTDIFRGPLAQGVAGLDFDLEQRFLVALVKDGRTTTLYAFDNVAGAVPRVLTDAQRLPALATMTNVQKFDHGKLGRVWRLDNFPLMSRSILLIDAANDGAFDGEPELVERANLEARGMDDYALWNSLHGP